MKLLYITVMMPFGECEPFFIPEVYEMVRQGCQLRIVPRSLSAEVNNRDAQGLVGPGRTSAAAVRRNPGGGPVGSAALPIRALGRWAGSSTAAT